MSSLASMVQAASVAGVEGRVGLRFADGDQPDGFVGVRLIVGAQLAERRVDDRKLFGAEGRASNRLARGRCAVSEVSPAAAPKGRLSQCPGCFDELRVVEGDQRLERGVGAARGGRCRPREKVR